VVDNEPKVTMADSNPDNKEQPAGESVRTGQPEAANAPEPECPVDDQLEPTETEPVDADLSDDDLDDHGGVDDTDDEPKPDLIESGGIGNSRAWADDEEPLPTVMVPRVRLDWPGPVAPLLSDVIDRPDGLDATALVSALHGLWATLADAVDQVGFGCLGRESVRWGAGQWQLAPIPSSFPGDGTHDSRRAAAGWWQDRYVLACALTEAAVGRWPVSREDLVVLVDNAAGTVAQGLDAVVNLLLSDVDRPGDVAGLQSLSEILAREPTDRIGVRCFRETMVGSAKARGGLADNEDAADFESAEDGEVRLALLDGITGEGDGSGHEAAWTALRAARTCWQQGKAEPKFVLSVADGEVRERVPHGGAAAVIVQLYQNGDGELASAGDSSAWLLRPDDPETPTRYHAWRLTPVHTAYAERHRLDPTVQGGQSVLVQHLGSVRRPFGARFQVAAGDLLVLVSDGASVPGEDDEWFGDTLTRIAKRRLDGGRPVAPGLAADLVVRAENLGGRDNATALVAETSRYTVGGGSVKR
jgi:Stage II sporulation protein E (SpoIIE)